jgi:hypothetical protein
MKRTAATPKPDIAVVILRWRPCFFFFWASPWYETRASKPTKKIESTLNTALIFTLAPLWVLGEGVLCCIATALRGLGHQCRREMVRSDKFVEQYDNIIKP